MVPNIPEHCLKCENWHLEKHRCDRVLRGSVRIGMEGGRLTGVMTFETAPGLLPPELEADLSEFLVESVPALIESWPKWDEVFRLHEDRHCAAEQPKLPCLKVVPRVPKPLPGYMRTESQSGF